MRKRAAGSDGSPIAHAARAAVRRRDLRFPCASGADPDRELGHFRIERPKPNQPTPVDDKSPRHPAPTQRRRSAGLHRGKAAAP